MSDATPQSADEVQGLVSQLLATTIRNGLQWVAGALIAGGWLASSQREAFVSIGVGLAVAAVAYGWSVVKTYVSHHQLKSAKAEADTATHYLNQMTQSGVAQSGSATGP